MLKLTKIIVFGLGLGLAFLGVYLYVSNADQWLAPFFFIPGVILSIIAWVLDRKNK